MTTDAVMDAAKRAKAFEDRADAEGWSDMRRHLGFSVAVWDRRKLARDVFLFDYGRDYAIDQHSFTLPRDQAQQCFMNATHLALALPHLTYVEGVVACHGVPIDHAWCVDEEGMVVDTTIRDAEDGHISSYFGVPFETDYLRKATLWNGVYGLLDCFYAKKTAPKLYELGLAGGQRWLLDQPARPPRKKRKA